MKNLGGGYSGCSNVPGLGTCQRPCCLVKSFPTLCFLMDCSTPDFHCPSPSPRVGSNSFPLSWWYHPTISSSVVPFSSRLQSFPASGSFPKSVLRIRWPNIGATALASVLSINVQDWVPLGWNGWISLQSKGLSRVFSGTTVWKHRFFCGQPL